MSSPLFAGAFGRWRILGWLAATGLAIVHVWMLNRYVVDFPFQDDFTQFLVVPGYWQYAPTLPAKLAYLFSSSGDHRIATLRLAALLQTGLSGGLDFRMLVYFGNLLIVLAGLLVVSRAEPRHRWLLAPLLAALLFSPVNFVAQFWASAALQHFSLVAYGLGAIYCLSRSGVAWQVGGLVLALCAALTGANGLTVFPAAAAVLFFGGRRRAALLWAALAIALWALYFIGHQTPVGRASLAQTVEHPILLFGFVLAALGSMAVRFDYAVACGATLVAVWIWLLATRRRGAISPLLLAWFSFLLLSTATIALGRASFGPDAVVNSRYRIYSEMAALVTMIAVLYRLAPRQGTWVLVALLPATAVWFGIGWTNDVLFIADIAARQRNSLDHYLSTGHGDYGGFPSQDFGDFMLQRAAAAGHFLPRSEAGAPAVLIEDTERPRATTSKTLLTEPPFLYAGAISVRGYALASERSVTLRLRDGGRQYGGALRTQRVFDAFASGGRLLFWNTFPLAAVAPGHYRVGYTLGDPTRPEVVWTENWVDVK